MGGIFTTTFLGHQGWMFRSARSCILVDPLLCEEFGHAHALSYRVFPPRILKPAAFPRLSAVILTHEHDDHFDIPSLAQIDRRVPVFLSSRSSMAGVRILGEMGFAVHPLIPGAVFEFGELEVVPLCGDHLNSNTGDEWDTLPFLVRHTRGAGSFFSTVDVKMMQSHIDIVRGRVPRPGIVGWTNNAQDWSHVASFLPERGDSTDPAIARMRAGHALIAAGWGTPAAMLMCAGGFSFHGERSWLNQRVFCVDADRVCQSMETLYRPQRFFAARPGQTFHMENNRLKGVDDDTPFLHLAPKATWPSRAIVPMTTFPDYQPATGKKGIGTDEVELLKRRLTEFAGCLLGGVVFKGLYSMLSVEAMGRMHTFAFVLRQDPGQKPLVFEYNPNGCTFDSVQRSEAPSIDSAQRGDADPREMYLAGMECWAGDLLAVLGGEIGPLCLVFGRAFLWNALPDQFNFDLFSELFRFNHPLRRPEEVYQIYQRLWTQHRQTSPPAPPILSQE